MDSDSEDEMPGLITNGDTNEECDEDDLEDDIGEEMYVDGLTPARDLFSSKTFPTAEECLEHCLTVHGLDLGVLAKRLNMDMFSYIRFVNFVRTESPSPGFVMSLSSDQKWADQAFLKPVVEDDPLLMIDFEQYLEASLEEEECGVEIDISRELDDQIANPRSVGQGQLVKNSNVAVKDGIVEIPVGKFEEMKKRFEEITLELTRKDQQLQNVLEDMTQMKSTAQTLFTDPSSEPTSRRSRGGVVPVSEANTVEEDHSYFQSYAHYSIHYEMLSDKTRTNSYRDALINNRDKLTSSLVLDIGCGTGILSMFAAQAGAKSVVGVDCSDIIYQAMDIVRENNMGDKVTLVKGRLEETKLPHEKFDIIVSEWMGYFLLFEGMLDSVLAARDKYLAPGGTILPNRCTIHLCAVSDPERYNSLVGFWSDVYGYKMSCMRSPILGEASVEVVGSQFVASSSPKVLDLDINTCSVADTEFTSSFTLEISRDCELTGILGYFDTFFDLPTSPVMFSTGPDSTPTHWKQTVFYLPEKISVVEGQELSGRIVCKRMKTDARALKVSLTLGDQTYRYTVD